MTFCQKPVYEMRAEKTRTSGDDRNTLGIFGHLGVVLIVAAQIYQQEVTRGEWRCSVRCPQRIPACPASCAEDSARYSIGTSSLIRRSTFVIYLLPCAFCRVSNQAERCTSAI